MLHKHKSIRSSVRVVPLTSQRDRAELLLARIIGRRLLASLSPQMHRAMAVDTSISNRVRNQKFTTALVWAVTYLNSVPEDDLPSNVGEASDVATSLIEHMEQTECGSST